MNFIRNLLRIEKKTQEKNGFNSQILKKKDGNTLTVIEPKELMVSTIEEEIPVVTLTRDDIIMREIDDHDPLTPNTAEV
tara:strand:- start:23 stop:259 length:237 start_codon:yes stop_codon:yes gene_type:complete